MLPQDSKRKIAEVVKPLHFAEKETGSERGSNLPQVTQPTNAEMRHFALAKGGWLEQWLQAGQPWATLLSPLHQWQAGISLWRGWCNVGRLQAGPSLLMASCQQPHWDASPPAFFSQCSFTQALLSQIHLPPLTFSPSCFLCLVPWAEQSCSFLPSGPLWVSLSRSESLFAALRPKGVNSTHYFTWGGERVPHW